MEDYEILFVKLLRKGKYPSKTIQQQKLDEKTQLLRPIRRKNIPFFAREIRI